MAPSNVHNIKSILLPVWGDELKLAVFDVSNNTLEVPLANRDVVVSEVAKDVKLAEYLVILESSTKQLGTASEP